MTNKTFQLETLTCPSCASKIETVFSGTVIESGYIKVRADRVGEDTTFARILQMVEEAQDKKAQAQM